MTTLNLKSRIGAFGEDKDVARELRQDLVLPSMASGEKVELDFKGVQLVTQSFIHALVSQAIRDYDDALDLLSFKNCTAAVREMVELVVEYSQDDWQEGP